MMKTLSLLVLCSACAAPGSTLSASRDAYPFTIAVEAGPVWQSKNDVRIPSDTGTEFSMKDLTGEGPYAAGRITAAWNINERHALRMVIAPLELDGTGTLSEQTSFAGESFAPDVSTKGTYKFSSYRIGYRYTFLHNEHWRLRVGGAIFVRDAKIELQQGSTSASDSNVGVVPLLSFSAEYYPAERWRIVGDVDGAAASQGRAFDISLKGYYDLSDRWSLGLGYRTVEGGSDGDEVYTFAWFQSVVASLEFRF